jgi:UDP-N-acetylglucosamine acyltransferase
MIHATAVVHPRAQLDASVQVGPYAVIDASVCIGAQCTVGPHVYLTGSTTIGAHNAFHAGCVIGDAPQDLKYNNVATRLRIGEHNVFREHVTVHRSNSADEDTLIGAHNFFMAHCHIAHNCRVGDHIIIANGALLAGHVTVQDRAFISGNCIVHQFCRIGTLSLMQGAAGISKDLPPFTVARHGDANTLCGLNSVGLRRAGFTAEERLELKRLYRELFTANVNLREALARARASFTSGAAKTLLDFVGESRRGVCTAKAGAAQDEPAAQSQAPVASDSQVL